MAWQQDINFRSTNGFVSDGAKAHHETSIASTNYPTAPSAGDAAFVGYTVGSQDPRNRDAGIDVRLAGCAITYAANPTYYRIDLPSTGTYTIRIAAGDAGTTWSFQKVEVFDNTTSKGVLCNGTTSTDFLDATNVNRSSAAWPGSNASVDVTFASTVCIFRIGDGTHDATIAHISVVAAAATPTITSVSTATPREGATLTITGTAFGASQGSGDVKINGVAQTVTSWSDTSIAVTIVLGTNKFGAAYTVVVRDNALTASNSYAGITGLLPANSGLSYVDIGTPDPTSNYRITAVGDLASGDQLEYENVGGAVSVASNGTFTVGPGVSSFSCRLWSTGVGYGTSGMQGTGGLPGDRRYLKLSPNIKLGW